jgi:hypothetical protein
VPTYILFADVATRDFGDRATLLDDVASFGKRQDRVHVLFDEHDRCAMIVADRS